MHPQHWNLVRSCVGIFGFTLAAVLKSHILPLATLYPVIGVFVVLAFIVGCVEVYGWLQRQKYRDYIYETLQPGELKGSLAAQWEQFSEQFELLGFRMVGDFVLDRGAPPTYARFALSLDPRIRAEVCSIGDDATPSFVTCFEDGRVIETSLHPSVETCCPPDQNLWFIVQHDGNIFNLFETHRRAIDAYTRETGIDALVATPERIFEFVQYSHRLMWWEKFHKPRELGPPEPPRPVRELLPAAPTAVR